MAIEDITGAMRTDPAGLAARLAGSVPSEPSEATDGGSGDGVRDGFRGGRTEALRRLSAIDPADYSRSRNFLAGRVTRLSPWIRHGALSLAEVRDHAIAVARSPEDAAKLVSELGWRDYWQRVLASIGDRIWSDIEPPAAEPRAPSRIDSLPDDVLSASTGMPCIDAFIEQLHRTGWLHNHARLWLASWLVHFRGVRWQRGAAWFLSHLIDGDPASNNLSWQWVAGTFSAKPYLFNRENLERYTEGLHCRGCDLLGRCEVEGSYEALSERLFRSSAPVRPKLRIEPAAPWRLARRDEAQGPPIVWLSLDALSDASPAAAAHPSAPRLFVFDPEWLAAERPSSKRIRFIVECLLEIPGVEVFLGDPREVVPARTRAHSATRVAIAETPCPRVRGQAERIGDVLPVEVLPWPRFCDDRRLVDLSRFSRYWQKVGESAMQPTEPAAS